MSNDKAQTPVSKSAAQKQTQTRKCKRKDENTLLDEQLKQLTKDNAKITRQLKELFLLKNHIEKVFCTSISINGIH